MKLSEPQVPKQHDHEAMDVKRIQNPGWKFLYGVVMEMKGMSIEVIEDARTEKTALTCSNQQGGCV